MILNILAVLILAVLSYLKLFSHSTTTPSPPPPPQKNQDQLIKLFTASLLKHALTQVQITLNTILLSTGSIQYDTILILDTHIDRMLYLVSLCKPTSSHYYFKDLFNDVYRMTTAGKRISDIWTFITGMKVYVNHTYTKPLHTIKQKEIHTLSDLHACMTQVQDLIVSLKKYTITQCISLLKQGNNDTMTQRLIKAFYRDTKRVLTDAIAYLTHLSSMQANLQMQAHIVDASDWLNTYNNSLCHFILQDCLYSFEDVAVDLVTLQNTFAQFEDDLLQFTAVTEDITSMDLFVNPATRQELDVDLYMRYTLVCRRAEKLLKFGRDVFSQREEITGFVDKYRFLQGKLFSCEVMDHFYQDLMMRFAWITFPQIGIEGLDRVVYDYQQALYLELSSMKLNFIQQCLS